MAQTKAMAEHQALYRKWRPKQFSEVVDQVYVVRTLINALSSDEIGHAYLFAGPRGTGKTTVARLVAKAVNCEQRIAGEPCNRCAACARISRGASLDVVEVDGASNRGIDQIRKLREGANFVPADVKYKVYIIDEVHMLTNEAFNALLKTLEEPPKRVIFIFATTESHKLPATVISRCQAFEFIRIRPEAVAAHLKRVCEVEGIRAEERALQAIAGRCGGALRDALVTLEQLAAYAQGDLISGEILETVLGLPSESLLKNVLQALLTENPESVITTLRQLSERGRDLELFLEELIRMSRDWLVQAVAKQPLPVETSVAALAHLTGHLLKLKRDMGHVWDKQIWLEAGMLQLGHPQTAAPQPPAAEQKTPQVDSPPLPEPEPDQDAWETLLTSVRNERVMVYAYLVEGRPRLEDGRLCIAYDQEHRFHKESLEKNEIKAYVLKKVEAAYQETLTLDVGFFAKASVPDEQVVPTQAPSQLDEKVALVKKILGEENAA